MGVVFVIAGSVWIFRDWFDPLYQKYVLGTDIEKEFENYYQSLWWKVQKPDQFYGRTREQETLKEFLENRETVQTGKHYFFNKIKNSFFINLLTLNKSALYFWTLKCWKNYIIRTIIPWKTQYTLFFFQEGS